MPSSQNITIQEESKIKEIVELIFKNYKLFIVFLIIAIGFAFVINRYSIPTYSVSSSILVKENTQQQTSNSRDFLYSNIFGGNQSFQNEFWIMKSYPVIEQTVKNLDLSVTYYGKGKFNYYEIYRNAPFIVYLVQDHVQPLNTKFIITIIKDSVINITAKSKNVSFYNFRNSKTEYQKEKWNFTRRAKFGELIETPDLAFLIQPRDTSQKVFDEELIYAFDFRKISSISNGIKKRLEFELADKQATVINVRLKSESATKGVDIVNELMNVYSLQNLEQKNHLASITISYIEKQLDEISDSLTQTEDYLQKFRASRQLLNITDQATGLSTQYLDLQNQLAELVSRQKYYNYVSDLLKSDNVSNIMLPGSMGISDQILNNRMSELITAQAQRTNLIENNQERNPVVQRLGIQIENLKKIISENIAMVVNTTSIQVEEMTRRIRKIESDINRLPATQRQLGTIERKYRLNDAIYNYLMEKHAEAKITKASNLPDDLIIEPAKMVGTGPVSPNKRLNYFIAFVLGLGFPFSYLMIKSALNNKIESQDDIEKLTISPVLGKIMHNKYKTRNVAYEFPKSNISESFRALRTNLDFYNKGEKKKVIMVTSCIENEGKSFIALNLAMSYAQLGRKTVLIDFDLRKPKSYFGNETGTHFGLTSYMINSLGLEDIIEHSPHDKLDYIQAGILPPNPVELIALEKTKELIDKLKNEYEIVLLDTTPLAQVTDAYLLIDFTDIKIIITRYSVTLKNVFSLIIKDLHLKNVDNICIVLNDNRYFRDQYGYGYGYYNKGVNKREERKRRQNIGEYYSK